MTSRCVLTGLFVLVVLVACLSGCGKKEDTPPAPAEASAKPSAPAPSATPSTAMAQFLDRKVRRRSAPAGQTLQDFFAAWEDVVKHRSRFPVDIHFQVDVNHTLQRDYAWSNATSRTILDELCQACALAWTITDAKTIRISPKTP